MAHGVLHRAQQQVRARPQTGPLRARVPPRSFETAERRAAEGVTWAALHRLAAALFHRDTASCQGSASRNTAMCMLRCLSRCRLLSSTEAWQDLCFCADAPRAVKPLVSRWPASFSQAAKTRAVSCVSHGSKNKSCLSVFPHTPATRTLHTLLHSLPHTQCSLPLAPGTQGGQRAALCSEEKGSNPTQSLCTAQDCSELALLDPIWDEG